MAKRPHVIALMLNSPLLCKQISGTSTCFRRSRCAFPWRSLEAPSPLMSLVSFSLLSIKCRLDFLDDCQGKAKPTFVVLSADWPSPTCRLSQKQSHSTRCHQSGCKRQECQPLPAGASQASKTDRRKQWEAISPKRVRQPLPQHTWSF